MIATATAAERLTARDATLQECNPYARGVGRYGKDAARAQIRAHALEHHGYLPHEVSAWWDAELALDEPLHLAAISSSAWSSAICELVFRSFDHLASWVKDLAPHLIDTQEWTIEVFAAARGPRNIVMPRDDRPTGVFRPRGQLHLYEPQPPAPRERDEPANVVYFIEQVGTGYVKIGTTCALADRLALLQTASPFELRPLITLPGGAVLERELHEQFALHRARGEWFRLEGELADFIADHHPQDAARREEIRAAA